MYGEPDYDIIEKANEIVDTNIPFISIEHDRYWYNNNCVCLSISCAIYIIPSFFNK
jgi:hypothetical protein